MPTGQPAQTLPTVVENPGTLTTNTVVLRRAEGHEVDLLSQPTKFPERALYLLGVDTESIAARARPTECRRLDGSPGLGGSVER
ncbi:MAG: hypothetical protein OXN89_06190 [Bryobacterales bacterium]|nr:hypothetical protein [Bryobacterales bacterium]